jgi:hypothetical protein
VSWATVFESNQRVRVRKQGRAGGVARLAAARRPQDEPFGEPGHMPQFPQRRVQDGQARQPRRLVVAACCQGVEQGQRASARILQCGAERARPHPAKLMINVVHAPILRSTWRGFELLIHCCRKEIIFTGNMS